MKKIIGILLVLFVVIGCSGSSKEEELLSKAGIQVNISDANTKEKGDNKIVSLSKDGCEYIITKNKDDEIIGFSAKGSAKCKDQGMKIVESDAFLSEKGIEEFKSDLKNSNDSKISTIIEGYTIKVTSDSLSIVKEKIPTTVAEVIKRLEDLDLPIADVVIYNEDSDPNELLGRPNSYIEKANFNDDNAIKNKMKKEKYSSKELEKVYRESLSNTLELFANKEDLNKRYEYIKGLSETESGILNPKQYLYKNGNFLLRITFDVKPSDAKKYEKFFNRLFEK